MLKNKDSWDSDEGATQCDMEAELRARKAEDLHKWSDGELEYEICDMFADWIDRKYDDAIQGTYPIQLENFYESIKPYVDEFRRRHPLRKLYDEKGNWIGGN